MDAKLVGRRIRKMRKDRGLTQLQVARKLGVDRKTVQRWEAGRSMPELEAFMAISDLLGVGTRYLAGLIGKPLGLARTDDELTLWERWRDLSEDSRKALTAMSLFLLTQQDSQRRVRRETSSDCEQ